jgi:hypothetical protein
MTRIKIAKAKWDFAKDGGAISTIVPKISATIPKGAVIKDVKVKVNTIVTGGASATVALSGGGVTLKAAESIANSVYAGTGVVDVIRNGNAGSTGTAKYIPITATNSAKIAVVVAGDALTAGKLEIFVEYTV